MVDSMAHKFLTESAITSLIWYWQLMAPQFSHTGGISSDQTE